jgi:cobalt-zinc-cadmium efflux system membrane fusion protein
MTRLFVLLLCAASITACRAADQPADAAAKSTAPAEPSAASTSPAGVKPAPGRVTLTTAQIAKVKVEELTTHAPADVIKATGTVEFNGDRMAKLLAPVAGQVQRLAVNVGDDVKKGQVLFTLSSRDVAAAVADHETAHKDFELAERTHAMTQDLYEHQAASRLSLQQSENELAKAQARVQQTAENLTVLGIDPASADGTVAHSSTVPVRAPIAGTIIDRAVTDGQFVGNDSNPLVTIADLSSVWVQADVFERDLRHIAVNETADVSTAAYPADTFVAHVSRIASVVDPQTRTAKVRFLVANAGERLKPGMYASIDLHLPGTTAAVTVPAKAAFVENGATFVYVQVGAQDFVRRSIQTTPSGADRLRVVSGLAAGDRVVADGVLLLRQLEADAGQ